jgi:hypothetical protein
MECVYCYSDDSDKTSNLLNAWRYCEVPCVGGNVATVSTVLNLGTPCRYQNQKAQCCCFRFSDKCKTTCCVFDYFLMVLMIVTSPIGLIVSFIVDLFNLILSIICCNICCEPCKKFGCCEIVAHTEHVRRTQKTIDV